MTDDDAHTQFTPTLQQKWRDGESTLGLWASLANSIAAEALARTGLDYVCIDTQHGLVDYSGAVPMIQAILLGGSSPIARVPWNEPGIIGKMLDAGAHGIIIPMVNTAEEAEAAVRACRYPPRGARSYGPGGVGPRTAGSYYDQADDLVAVIPMIETVQAVSNLDEILAVPGIDAIYVGPADLSISLGLPPRNNDDSPAFTEALKTIVAGCNKAGVIPGIHATGALTPTRFAQGFRMVTVTADTVALRLGLDLEIAVARDTSQRDSASNTY